MKSTGFKPVKLTRGTFFGSVTWQCDNCAAYGVPLQDSGRISFLFFFFFFEVIFCKETIQARKRRRKIYSRIYIYSQKKSGSLTLSCCLSAWPPVRLSNSWWQIPVSPMIWISLSKGRNRIGWLVKEMQIVPEDSWILLGCDGDHEEYVYRWSVDIWRSCSREHHYLLTCNLICIHLEGSRPLSKKKSRWHFCDSYSRNIIQISIARACQLPIHSSIISLHHNSAMIPTI